MAHSHEVKRRFLLSDSDTITSHVLTARTSDYEHTSRRSQILFFAWRCLHTNTPQKQNITNVTWVWLRTCARMCTRARAHTHWHTYTHKRAHRRSGRRKTKTDRQTGRQTSEIDKQTSRWADKQTDGQAAKRITDSKSICLRNGKNEYLSLHIQYDCGYVVLHHCTESFFLHWVQFMIFRMTQPWCTHQWVSNYWQ